MDKKISELTAATSVTLADVLPIVQASSTKKVTAQILFENIPSSVKYAGISVETGTPDTIQGGAASLLTANTYLTNLTTGIVTVTLAAGTQGQEKTFVCSQLDTNNIDLIPTNRAGYAKVTFSGVGQSVVLKYLSSKWFIVSLYGAVSS